MRNGPLLSVCIPAYNRAVLDELLRSVLSQDFGDFEIVVCEDPSPEMLPAFVRSKGHGLQ